MVTPPNPLVAAPDKAFDARVEAAAFALLRDGKNPTVAAVRERIGGASPNVVAPALKRWRAAFAAHLQDSAGAAQDVLPPGILEIVQALWSRALFEAHRVRADAQSPSEVLEQLNTTITELNARLAVVQAREAELEAERRALARERRRLAALESKTARARPRRPRAAPKRASKRVPTRRRPAPSQRRASRPTHRR